MQLRFNKSSSLADGTLLYCDNQPAVNMLKQSLRYDCIIISHVGLQMSGLEDPGWNGCQEDQPAEVRSIQKYQVS